MLLLFSDMPSPNLLSKPHLTFFGKFLSKPITPLLVYSKTRSFRVRFEVVKCSRIYVPAFQIQKAYRHSLITAFAKGSSSQTSWKDNSVKVIIMKDTCTCNSLKVHSPLLLEVSNTFTQTTATQRVELFRSGSCQNLHPRYY